MIATRPALLLVAHGTRNPRGVRMIADLADEVSKTVGVTRVAFVDVLGPTPSEVLRHTPGPAVVVPAFLASGYHVRTDVPNEVLASGHPVTAITPALGPDPALTTVLAERLHECGWRTGDAVVLAAAGSSDPHALGDVRRAARMLSSRLRTTVRVGYVATARPTVNAAVAELRAQGARRVFVASYLLADGLFHARLAQAGADGVSAPLGVAAPVVDLVVRRYLAAAESVVEGARPTLDNHTP